MKLWTKLHSVTQGGVRTQGWSWWSCNPASLVRDLCASPTGAQSLANEARV